MHFWLSLACCQPTLLALPFRRLQGEKSCVSFSGVSMSPICRLKVCSGGSLMSSYSVKNVTWAFNLQRRSCPKRGIGHSGIYKKMCFRVRSPSWHSRGCKNERFCTSPETPMTGMDWDVFCATLVFTTEYVAPISIRKSINLFCTVKVARDSCGEIGIWCIKSKGAPDLFIYHERSSLSTIQESLPASFYRFCSYILA